MWYILGLVLFLVLLAWTVVYEYRNPCQEWGPLRLSHVQDIGNGVLQPVYVQDCLVRVKR